MGWDFNWTRSLRDARPGRGRRAPMKGDLTDCWAAECWLRPWRPDGPPIVWYSNSCGPSLPWSDLTRRPSLPWSDLTRRRRLGGQRGSGDHRHQGRLESLAGGWRAECGRGRLALGGPDDEATAAAGKSSGRGLLMCGPKQSVSINSSYSQQFSCSGRIIMSPSAAGDTDSSMSP